MNKTERLTRLFGKRVMQQFSDAVSALQRAIFDVTFVREAAHMALTIQEHRDLFEAIRRKLPDTAEATSRRMIERTAQRAFSGMNRDDGKIGTLSPFTEMDS